MKSLKDALNKLSYYYPLKKFNNVKDAANIMNMPPPVSVKSLINKIDSLKIEGSTTVILIPTQKDSHYYASNTYWAKIISPSLPNGFVSQITQVKNDTSQYSLNLWHKDDVGSLRDGPNNNGISLDPDEITSYFNDMRVGGDWIATAGAPGFPPDYSIIIEWKTKCL